jgi:hypothetical protein
MNRILILICYCFFGAISNAQEINKYDSCEINYLELNNLKFDFNDDFNVFLVGERHNHNYNSKYELVVFKDALERKKVNALLFEGGASSEYLLNKYINGYDLVEEYYDDKSIKYINELIKINKKNKFDIYGIDVQKNLFDVIISLEIMLKNKVGHLNGVYKRVELIKNKGTSENSFLESDIKYFINDFITFKNIYQENLSKSDYEYITRIVNGINAYFKMSYDLNNDTLKTNFREEFMSNELINIISSDSNLILFGSFGRNHVVKNSRFFKGLKNWHSFSERIEDNGIKVCRVMSLYNYDYRSDYFYHNVVPYNDMIFFKSNAKAPLTLYSMRNQKPYYTEYGYDYLLYIKGGHKWNRDAGIIKWWFCKR